MNSLGGFYLQFSLESHSCRWTELRENIRAKWQVSGTDTFYFFFFFSFFSFLNSSKLNYDCSND
jgi:hypothetical protein